MPGPDEDLQIMSDYLLSLETRDDLTAHVLRQTEACSEMRSLSGRLFGGETGYDVKSRAIALKERWGNVKL
jgi:hypothetical protein